MYLDLAVRGVRSSEITAKIELHLERFIAFFENRYGHERISVCLQRDVLAWRDDYLTEDCAFAPATVNNHLASLSKCCAWINARDPQLFPAGNACSHVKELPLPPLSPKSLSDAPVGWVRFVREWYRRAGFAHRGGSEERIARPDFSAAPICRRFVVPTRMSANAAATDAM